MLCTNLVVLESLAVPPLTCCQQQNTSEVLTCWRPLITATQYQSGLKVSSLTALNFKMEPIRMWDRWTKDILKKTKQIKKALCSHTQRVTWLSYIYKSIQCLAAKVKDMIFKKKALRGSYGCLGKQMEKICKLS